MGHSNSKYLNKIHKAPCDNENIYCKVNKEAMFNAMKELSGVEFELWLFCASQSEKLNHFEFGPAGVGSITGITESSFKRGKRALIDKGYLVEDGNLLEFFEIPRDKGSKMNPVQNEPIVAGGQNEPVQNGPIVFTGQNGKIFEF